MIRNPFQTGREDDSVAVDGAAARVGDGAVESEETCEAQIGDGCGADECPRTTGSLHCPCGRLDGCGADGAGRQRFGILDFGNGEIGARNAVEGTALAAAVAAALGDGAGDGVSQGRSCGHVCRVAAAAADACAAAAAAWNLADDVAAAACGGGDPSFCYWMHAWFWGCFTFSLPISLWEGRSLKSRLPLVLLWWQTVVLSRPVSLSRSRDERGYQCQLERKEKIRSDLNAFSLLCERGERERGEERKNVIGISVSLSFSLYHDIHLCCLHPIVIFHFLRWFFRSVDPTFVFLPQSVTSPDRKDKIVIGKTVQQHSYKLPFPRMIFNALI